MSPRPLTHTPHSQPMTFAGWAQVSAAALAAVIIGFFSTILVVIDAVAKLGGTPAQQTSMVLILCLCVASTSLVLSLVWRMPLITAWSTPGAALIAMAASPGTMSFAQSLGAFMVAGLLMCLAGAFRPLARAISRIPSAIAAGMVAGVLMIYCMKVAPAAAGMPTLVIFLAVVFFAARILVPMFAVPIIVVVAVLTLPFVGGIAPDCCQMVPVTPGWTMPEFEWRSIVGIGVPYFLVTITSQNLPGFAVLRGAGYHPPISGALWFTGLASILIVPFGAFGVNMAAITANIVTGPDCHPDPGKRWMTAIPFFVIYSIVGFLGVLFVPILHALPAALVAAIVGLALFGPLLSNVSAMMAGPATVEAALVTFIVTASGMTAGGIGSAFWGLLAGLVVYGMRKAFEPRSSPGP